jgi:predicted ArsR family transcriptional regulator
MRSEERRDEDVAAVAALAEPLRRRLYLHVAAAAEPVSRDDAAGALGIARSVVAFHLDKLAELGLLDVEFRRPPGRRGPGAGRPAKLYRRSSTGDIAFVVPERHYEVAASVLARVVERVLADGVATPDAVSAVARDFGRAVGIELRTTGAAPLVDPEASALEALSGALEQRGYEPRVDDGVMTLTNCPFRSLSDEHTDLVCSLNLELLSGLLESLGAGDVMPRLDPEPGRCCVTLTVC